MVKIGPAMALNPVSYPSPWCDYSTPVGIPYFTLCKWGLPTQFCQAGLEGQTFDHPGNVRAGIELVSCKIDESVLDGPVRYRRPNTRWTNNVCNSDASHVIWAGLSYRRHRSGRTGSKHGSINDNWLHPPAQV